MLKENWRDHKRRNKIDVQRFGRLTKEAGWILFGQIMAVGGALIGVRFLTTLLNPTQYGEFALGLTAAGLVNQAIMCPLSSGVSRFYVPALEARSINAYIRACSQLALRATAFIGTMVVLMIAGLTILRLTQWMAITIGAFVLALVDGYGGVINAVQVAARRRWIVALHQGAESWLRFALAAVLLTTLGRSSNVAMLGYVTAALVVLGSQWFFLAGTVDLAPGSDGAGVVMWRDRIWRFSLPIGTWGIFAWFQLASDRWALHFFSTAREVGLYAVIYQLGYYPMILLTGMLTQFFAPILYQRAGDASKPARNANVTFLVRRMEVAALSFTIVVFLSAALLHNVIFRVFVSPQYGGVSYLLPWMILAGGVFAAGQTLALRFLSEMRTAELLRVKIATAVLGVLFNGVGAYFGGVEGVIFAAGCFSIVYYLWMRIIADMTTAS